MEGALPEFIAAQMKGIVGIEIEIETIDGKWKVSQNRPLADRQGLAEGLSAIDRTAAAEMAELVRRYSKQ
ncbi:transcriptional regulator [Rhizobium tropici CIAT 899]|uniref:Transcriptional regulator n=1 Tax=Rhizobium tropici TaxID=398 RepID=A0ABR6R6H0_RHITR|nr:transcriptional regulator [Rhizobium tropici CIAT 899]MBB4244445.1 transcriptional regulator [Rhizobium tropici]MBB5595611.1 transcriptional regulator [Rhizobium tropici]MBB6494784.1 transcriptional regulator [Rhizobium tropici]